MLNRSGVRTTTYGATKQILANVELQSSVGCIVPESLGTFDGVKKLVKAGTPINIDLMNLQNEVKAANGSVACNAVLLHDVDVINGAANGTALIFGFVNVNSLDADVVTAISNVTNMSPMLTFIQPVSRGK